MIPNGLCSGRWQRKGAVAVIILNEVGANVFGFLREGKELVTVRFWKLAIFFALDSSLDFIVSFNPYWL